eukprot:m.263146 g.263146  ORF g.263146 m.263146 type:complete len:166 (+) comp11051_c1_seq2:256-753(+)
MSGPPPAYAPTFKPESGAGAQYPPTASSPTSPTSPYPPQQQYPPQYPAQPSYPPQPAQPGAYPVHSTQPGAYPQQGAYMTTTTVVQPAYMMWGRHPVMHTCAFCKVTGPTVVRTEVGMSTHLLAGGICLIGCCPCCLIPYCMDDCKDAVHYCHACNQVVGRKSLF